MDRSNQILLRLARSETLDSGDLNAAFREITRASAEALQCERVSVWLYEHRRSAIRCACQFLLSADEYSAGAALRRADYPNYFEALKTGHVIAANDARRHGATKEFAASYLKSNDIRSMLDAPILFEGKMVGVVCHEHIGAQRRWTKEEELLAGGMADMAARAMGAQARAAAQAALRETNRSLEALVAERTQQLAAANEALRARNDEVLQDMRLARRLQTSLVRSRGFGAGRGLVWSAAFEPYDELGGDFYDVISAQRNRSLFILADASGHGMTAALTAVLARAIISNIGRGGIDLGELCYTANKEIWRTLQDSNQYVTAFLAIYEPASRELQYLSAGHPPAVMHRAGLPPALIEDGVHLFLGVDAEAEFHPMKVNVGPGDRLLVFSDGIVEARNQADQEFGYSRLLQLLAEKPTEAARIPDLVMEAVAAFRGKVASEDDMTLLSIEFV